MDLDRSCSGRSSMRHAPVWSSAGQNASRPRSRAALLSPIRVRSVSSAVVRQRLRGYSRSPLPGRRDSGRNCPSEPDIAALGKRQSRRSRCPRTALTSMSSPRCRADRCARGASPAIAYQGRRSADSRRSHPALRPPRQFVIVQFVSWAELQSKKIPLYSNSAVLLLNVFEVAKSELPSHPNSAMPEVVADFRRWCFGMKIFPVPALEYRRRRRSRW